MVQFTLIKTMGKLSKEKPKMFFHKCVDYAGLDLHNKLTFVSINKDQKKCLQGNPINMFGNTTLIQDFEILPKNECDNTIEVIQKDPLTQELIQEKRAVGDTSDKNYLSLYATDGVTEIDMRQIKCYHQWNSNEGYQKNFTFTREQFCNQKSQDEICGEFEQIYTEEDYDFTSSMLATYILLDCVMLFKLIGHFNALPSAVRT